MIERLANSNSGKNDCGWQLLQAKDRLVAVKYSSTAARSHTNISKVWIKGQNRSALNIFKKNSDRTRVQEVAV